MLAVPPSVVEEWTGPERRRWGTQGCRRAVFGSALVARGHPRCVVVSRPPVGRRLRLPGVFARRVPQQSGRGCASLSSTWLTSSLRSVHPVFSAGWHPRRVVAGLLSGESYTVPAGLSPLSGLSSLWTVVLSLLAWLTAVLSGGLPLTSLGRLSTSASPLFRPGTASPDCPTWSVLSWTAVPRRCCHPGAFRRFSRTSLGGLSIIVGTGLYCSRRFAPGLSGLS